MNPKPKDDSANNIESSSWAKLWLTDTYYSSRPPRLCSTSGCFIASILMGMIQTFAVVINYSLLDLIKPLGITVTGDNLFTEILTVPVARIGALLPFAMMIIILSFRPRGLMGTRDT